MMHGLRIMQFKKKWDLELNLFSHALKLCWKTLQKTTSMNGRGFKMPGIQSFINRQQSRSTHIVIKFCFKNPHIRLIKWYLLGFYKCVLTSIKSIKLKIHTLKLIQLTLSLSILKQNSVLDIWLLFIQHCPHYKSYSLYIINEK